MVIISSPHRDLHGGAPGAAAPLSETRHVSAGGRPMIAGAEWPGIFG